MINYRSRTGKLCLLAILLACISACNNQPDDRPNILFVITDDQSWLHTSFSGEPEVSTPNFDRIAREGMYFSRAYVSAPTCTASRSAILAGQHFWRLEQAATLWGQFQQSTLSYQRELANAGYQIGYTGKGWGPGRFDGQDPVGRSYNGILHNNRPSQHVSEIDYAANFRAFLDDSDGSEPFSFWFSPLEPHRPYQGGQGANEQIDPDAISVPDFLPDTPIVRRDLADYYHEINWQDVALGKILVELETRGLLDNTIIVATSDNGMPFPRAKSTNYEFGTRVPLAMRWGSTIQSGSTSDAIVNLSDLAPTFLAAAGIEIPIEMTGRNLLSVLTGNIDQATDSFSHTITGFERHILNARENNDTYPVRAIHTERYSLIQNFEPERWPAGDPPTFRDIDSTSPSKDQVLQTDAYLALATDKRPRLELYDLEQDPYQLNNLADNPEFAPVLEELENLLMQELENSEDPLLIQGTDAFSQFPYFGEVN